ncbi:HAMP domain-containing sensor histidine kinase [Methylocapsa sp. S129]|uniref:sensor histidine kinase n=1 Tax=Methylocapsa sp. S129 TaxID=1641869 RepID=UPI00131B7E1A|nr:ATP-binding protein [Methylocapsa sp. S129]
MLTIALRFIDWFIPERAKRTRSDLGRARTFVFTHLVGPVTGQSIAAFLFLADPRPDSHIVVIALGIGLFAALPFLLKMTGSLLLVAMISVETLIAVTLFGAYFYGGVSSPFLPWLLIALLNGLFYLSDRPLSVLGIFVANFAVFLAFWYAAGSLPDRVPMERMSVVGLVSVASATLYMAWVAIYYGLLLASESALQREVLRHRNTAERLLHAKDKAEKANKDKSIFLAKMSHELRTPLNAVIGYSEILLEDCEPATNPQRRQDLGRINAAGKHLLSLVADVLDISQIETSALQLNVERFSLPRLIDDVAATSQVLLARNHNQLVLSVDPAVGVMESDETKMRQAILNLMSNAAKFTNRGVVTLSARSYRAAGADWIEIAVRDTGIGISAQNLKTLFQDYRQIDVALNRAGEGTGLGLALTQRLCALMGGGISIDSELGHGACFTIRVPASLPETNAAAFYRDSENDELEEFALSA